MNPGNHLDAKRFVILAFIAMLVVGGFLLYSTMTGYAGFPLDDAWIHQVYARNLVLRGEWAFNPGQPSGGSTAPLWSILLGGAYLLHIQPVIWSAILGWLTLTGIAFLGDRIVRSQMPGYSTAFPWVGLFFALEWHLVWAAVSGMETAFFILMIFLVLWSAQRAKGTAWLTGLLIGVAAWVRPDGITLLGPALFVNFFRPGSLKEKIRPCVEIIVGFGLTFLPYLLFNLHQARSIWPTTFAAKQAEYQVTTAFPLLQRIGWLFLPFLAGGGVILLPGVITGLVYGWRDRNPVLGSMLLWFSGYLLIYAVRLPVYYQHGRYMMPAMACFFLFGLWGGWRWIKEWPSTRWGNLAKVFALACLTSVTLLFLAVGGQTYRTDVAIIETEMVTTAKWIEKNTPAGSRLAVHDIGAVGYFSGRDVVDLAGLVNPEVIPFIRDESKLREYLSSQNVQYLVTFPGWYPELTKGHAIIHQSNGNVSSEVGGENMVVYVWN